MEELQAILCTAGFQDLLQGVFIRWSRHLRYSPDRFVRPECACRDRVTSHASRTTDMYTSPRRKSVEPDAQRRSIARALRFAASIAFQREHGPQPIASERPSGEDAVYRLRSDRTAAHDETSNLPPDQIRRVPVFPTPTTRRESTSCIGSDVWYSFDRDALRCRASSSITASHVNADLTSGRILSH